MANEAPSDDNHNKHPPIPPEIKEMLMCPISHEIMKDPVVTFPFGHTYDHESLCHCLLRIHRLRVPFTNQKVAFGEKITFASNITVCMLLTIYYGDAAYEKYDDADFKHQYEQTWNEFMEEEAAKEQDRLGVDYYNQEQFEQAKQCLEHAAAQGFVLAQNNLSIIYNTGIGGPQDSEQARDYFELAADQGDATAQ